MRLKRISVMAVCIMLVMAGCGESGEKKAFARIAETASLPFYFAAEATLDGISQTIVIDATKSADGLVLELGAQSPAAGLRVEFDDSGTCVSYHGLVMNMAEGDIPEQSIFTALRDVLSALPDTNGECRYSHGEIIISGRAGMTGYTMAWNADSAEIKSISLPAVGVFLKILEFRR